MMNAVNSIAYSEFKLIYKNWCAGGVMDKDLEWESEQSSNSIKVCYINLHANTLWERYESISSPQLWVKQ